jgi:hypothetical protein
MSDTFTIYEPGTTTLEPIDDSFEFLYESSEDIYNYLIPQREKKPEKQP